MSSLLFRVIGLLFSVIIATSIIHGCYNDPQIRFHSEDSLRQKGIEKGKHIWLKYAMTGIYYRKTLDKNTFQMKEEKYYNISLPGFNEVVIEDIRIINDGSGQNMHQTITIMAREREDFELFEFIWHYPKTSNAKDKIEDAFFVTYPIDKYISKWGKERVEIIKRGRIEFGMTDEQVRMSYGHPKKIKAERHELTKTEKWTYMDIANNANIDDYPYLYFENGIFVSEKD